MQTRLMCIISLVVALGLASGVAAEPFEIGPTFDTEIGNDGSLGPDSSSNGTGMGMRDISSRRRVAYVTYDLTEVKAMGAFFSNVRFSNYGHDLSNPVSVYGVLEAYEDRVGPGVTWRTGPGVQNNPLPALDAPVALNPTELTDVLLTFTPPAQGVREETETSEALAEFLNSDTNGFVAFLFAPAAPGNQAIVRTMELAAGGTQLLGDIGGSATSASRPTPSDGTTDIVRDVVLSWNPGGYAVTRNVYFGTSFEDVSSASVSNPMGVLASQGQTDAAFAPDGLLGFGQTYYWRVDEVNGAPDFTVYEGNVWSFTTEPFSYLLTDVEATASIPSSANSGPEKAVDGSGLTDGQHSTEEAHMWIGIAEEDDPVWIQFHFDRTYKMHEMHIWNYNGDYEYILGLGANEVTIEYTADGNDWTTLGDYVLERATSSAEYTGAPLDLEGIAAQSIRINIHSNRNPNQLRYGLSEVQFYMIPAHAREPQPASGATGVDPGTDLSWRAGREAASHHVYLSTDEQAVADGTALVDAITTSRFDPGPLTLGETYYWRVDEVNEAATPSVWPGDLWSFSTQEYFIVDDFESYTDDDNLIFETWLDGYEVGDNGSIVGYNLPPYAERGNVRSGSQAMPFFYDNKSGVVVSEAERTFAPAQDWTLNGADTLTLFFRGEPIGFLQAPDGTILMNGQGTDIWGTADEGRFAYKSLAGDGTIIAKVESLDNTDPWAKAGVMIRESLNPGAAWALITATPENGVRYQARLLPGAEATSDSELTLPEEQTSLEAPVWIKLERVGNQFNGYYATDEAGTNWEPLLWNPQTIAMTGTVYIGLAVTSHATAAVTQAVFSGVETTGATGQWQSASLTVDQPQGNGVDRFYIAVEDSSGRKATVAHPDPYAVGAGAWRQWDVALSDLSAAGVNTSSIRKMVLGIGDRTKPSQNAAGRLLIDDIQVGRPAVQE